MNAVRQQPLSAAARDIEERIFRRGVSDQEVRQAIDLVAEYVATHTEQAPEGQDWWSAFAEVYEDLTRNFSVAQTEAFEIATDTILVGCGRPRWSCMRGGAGARRALPQSGGMPGRWSSAA